MYLAQEIADAIIKEITELFGLKSAGSIPRVIKKLKCLLDEDEALSNTINKMIDEYDA